MINSPSITFTSAKEKKQLPIDAYRLLTDEKSEANHSKSSSKTEETPEADHSKLDSSTEDYYIPKSTLILTKEFATDEPDTLSFDESDTR